MVTLPHFLSQLSEQTIIYQCSPCLFHIQDYLQLLKIVLRWGMGQREIQEKGSRVIYVVMTDSHHTTNQYNIVKQLSTN